MRCFVYWNLHKSCWSIKALSGPEAGRVVAHASAVELRDCEFKVSEAGRQRVLRECRKNVHAGVVGHLRSLQSIDARMGRVGAVNLTWPLVAQAPADAVAITYNPYREGQFVSSDLLRCPMSKAPNVVMHGRMVHAFA